MGNEKWDILSGGLYGEDPRLDAFSNLNSFNTKSKSNNNGKGDPLAFSVVGGSEEESKEDEEDEEDEVDDWPSAPPVDYLERVQVHNAGFSDQTSIH